MLNGRRSSRGSSRQNMDYWMSYSDLMSGLLLVFIILLIGVLYVSKHDMEVKVKKLDEQAQQIEAEQKKLKAAEADLKHLNSGLSDVFDVRTRLLERLREQFSNSDSEVTFDDATGAVRLGSNILFDEGSDTLSKRGQQAIAKHMPVYLNALLSDPELRKEVDQIIFEGHTNSNYSGSSSAEAAYLFNLQLSQNRAYSAMTYVISSGVATDFDAQPLLSAIGFSHSRPILDADKIENKERSRRLEIKFRLKDEEAMARMRVLFEHRKIRAEVDP